MKLLLVIGSLLLTTSVYTLQYNDIDGNQISMSIYSSKKILIVNIATNSSKISQLAGLQQLYQTYGDSLEIIAFPSNSFGNEPKSNAEIKSFCQANYGVTFKIASKNPVAGTGVQSIYYWLSHVSENGVMNEEVIGDFQKYLIDKNGNLIGVFSPSTNPMGSEIVNAISN
jgi:glutathione peroxidase